MCETCGCGDPALVPVDLHFSILSQNDVQARHNRQHFAAAGVLALNLMGSPGAGKTALLEATARACAGRLRLGAVSGDLATDHDAKRLEKAGIPSLAITTGNACHLDADMVHKALHDIDWRASDCFVIENVGNLVCPAVYDLGQAQNVVVVSVTEGEDKPLKYPVMFRKADLVVLSKVDLLPHLPGYSLEAFETALAQVMPEPRCLRVSATSGEGVSAWVDYLLAQRAALPARAPVPTQVGHPHE